MPPSSTAAVSSPHDALFKAIFEQPDRAAGELQAVLPTALAAQLDWSSLALQPGSFVDPDLVGRHTDLLFQVGVVGGGSVQLFFLFEHQSTVDPLMAFRVGRYMVRIWERWLDTNKGARVLPAIIPIVLFHGPGGWSAPTELSELIDLGPTLAAAAAPLLPRLRFLLDDLSASSDTELRARAMEASAKLVLLSLKHARDRPDELEERVAEWIDLVGDVLAAPHGLQALATVMRYILEVGGPTVLEHLRERFVPVLGPRAEEAMITAAQVLREEGRQEGRQEGQRDLLTRLLIVRFGGVPAWATAKVQAADAGSLGRWAERVVLAAQIEDVFAE